MRRVKAEAGPVLDSCRPAVYKREIQTMQACTVYRERDSKREIEQKSFYGDLFNTQDTLSIPVKAHIGMPNGTNPKLLVRKP